MASPAPPPQPTGDSHYFALTIAVVAVMVILSNIIAFACCSPCHFVESLRRLFRRPEEVSTGETKNVKTAKVIPALKYHNERDEEDASDSGCSVCLSPFLDGEYIRQLPPCKHTFHAACIDMWLYSHSNCPLCRASVPVRPPRRPTAAAEADPGPGPQRHMEYGDMVSIVGDLV